MGLRQDQLQEGSFQWGEFLQGVCKGYIATMGSYIMGIEGNCKVPTWFPPLDKGRRRR